MVSVWVSNGSRKPRAADKTMTSHISSSCSVTFAILGKFAFYLDTIEEMRSAMGVVIVSLEATSPFAQALWTQGSTLYISNRNRTGSLSLSLLHLKARSQVHSMDVATER